MKTVAFCEIEPYCVAVLNKNWPGVPVYGDVKTLTANTLRRDGIVVDVICGGFPCTDVSFAGKRAGLEGTRSGLWSEFRRIIGEVRPRFVAIENVPGLLSLGMDTVLSDLAALGYDAVWDCVPASALGAPHRRDRVWIVARATRERCGEARQHSDQGEERTASGGEDVANANNARLEGRQRAVVRERTGEWAAGQGGASISDTASAECEGIRAIQDRQQGRLADGGRREPESRLGRVADGSSDWLDGSFWLEEPEGAPRVAKSIENRAARLKALGNGIVPQVAYLIGRAIMSAEGK